MNHSLPDELLSGRRPAVAVLCATRVDTGRWFIRSRVRVAVTDEELILFAPGPEPYVQRIRFADLGESLYNHVTGSLVLAPARDVRVRSLRMPPVEARQILTRIVDQASGLPDRAGGTPAPRSSALLNSEDPGHA